MDKEKDGNGKNENERADEESEVKMQVASDGVKAPVHGAEGKSRNWEMSIDSQNRQ